MRARRVGPLNPFRIFTRLGWSLLAVAILSFVTAVALIFKGG